MNKPVRQSTQGGEFNTNYASKVEIVMSNIDAMKNVIWNFQMDVLQDTNRYTMILGQDILSEINIELCLYDNYIRGNGSAHKGCRTPMKDASKIKFNS